MKNDLKEYLLKIAKEGYATNDEQGWTKEKDGSTTILNSTKDWSMNDNFFGGEPYGGREVIFHKGKPYWIMVYYGMVVKNVKDVGQIYKFLQKALAKTDKNFPLRGPKALIEENLKYENTWSGDIEKYHGQEDIYLSGQKVYSANYMGGLVDQRGE